MLSKLDEYLIKRRKKGITHTELAEHIDCSQSLISLYERGKTKMDVHKVIKYQEYIDEKITE